jgi:hypothetical protein
MDIVTKRAAALLTETMDKGGATFEARTLRPVTSGGWCVGGGMPGYTFVADSADPMRGLTSAIDGLIEDGARRIGTWLDDGVVYVDAIDIITNTDEAIRLARSRGEKAIYHLTDKITLEVSYDG